VRCLNQTKTDKAALLAKHAEKLSFKY
jgi:hypothetical protein